MKTSWRCLEEIFAGPLADVLKTSSRFFQEVFARRLEDVLKTCWRHLSKTFWRRFEDALKTHDQDEYIRLDQDTLKMSWRRLLKMKTKDDFKPFSRRLYQDKCFLGSVCKNWKRFTKCFPCGSCCTSDCIKQSTRLFTNISKITERHDNFRGILTYSYFLHHLVGFLS